MSEKRFSVRLRSECDGVVYSFFDGDKPLDVDMIVDVLNEQQATISKQLDQIIELQDKYRILEFNHSRLEKRNKKQYGKIGEQQATIDRLKNAIRIAYEEKPYPKLEDIKAKYKEYDEI